MRYKNEEHLFLISFSLILIFLCLLIFGYKIKYPKYKVLYGYHIIDGVYEFKLGCEDTKYIQKNKFIYYNSKKIKVEIVSIIKGAYKKKEQNQLLLKLNKINKTDNIISVSIYDKKKNYISLFFDCIKEIYN